MLSSYICCSWSGVYTRDSDPIDITWLFLRCLAAKFWIFGSIAINKLKLLFCGENSVSLGLDSDNTELKNPSTLLLFLIFDFLSEFERFLVLFI